MGNSDLNAEKVVDVDDFLYDSFSQQDNSEEREELLLRYLCQTLSKADDYDSIKKRAFEGEPYAFIQLASWNIANAKNIKDYCSAFYYANKAVLNGYKEGYYILGQLYYYGLGCERNKVRAGKCLYNFITQVSKKELISDSVYIDSIYRLAVIEKELKHYDKASTYFHRLATIEPKYTNLADEFDKEVRERRKDILNGTIIVAISLLMLGIGAYWVTDYIKDEMAYATNRYEPKVGVVYYEIENNNKEVDDNDIIYKEAVKYKLISASAFEQQNFTELRVSNVKATSEYISQVGNDYSASRLIDHNSNTMWQEGAVDDGVGQKIEIKLEDEALISGMVILNGKQTDEKAYYDNNRVSKFEIFDEEKLMVELPDSMYKQYILFENPIMTSEISITIKGVYAGETYNDTCVTEISLFE